MREPEKEPVCLECVFGLLGRDVGLSETTVGDGQVPDPVSVVGEGGLELFVREDLGQTDPKKARLQRHFEGLDSQGGDLTAPNPPLTIIAKVEGSQRAFVQSLHASGRFAKRGASSLHQAKWLWRQLHDVEDHLRPFRPK